RRAATRPHRGRRGRRRRGSPRGGRPPPRRDGPGRRGCRRRARRGRTPSASRPECIVDGGAEALDRLRAHDRFAVDEKGRRAAHPEFPAFGEVRFDGRAEPATVHAALEAVAIEVEIDGIAHEIVALEAWLAREEHVVIRPVSSLVAGAPRRLVGGHGQSVRRQGEVLVDEPYLPVVLLEELIQRPLDALAEGSLVVGELDDRHGRRRGSLRHLRLAREAILRAGRRRAAADADEDGTDREPKRDGVDSPRLGGKAHDGGGYHMAILDAVLATYPSWSLLVVRLALGVVFFAHGSQKVLGTFGGHGLAATIKMFEGMGVRPAATVLAALIEFLGGCALVVGVLARPAAVGIIVVMLVAIRMVHGRHGF